MAYRVEVGAKATAQLDALDSTVGSSVERKIVWLAENAAVMVHRRLVGMPEDLSGLCKLRVRDGGFSTGLITQSNSSAFIACNIDRKCIATFD